MPRHYLLVTIGSHGDVHPFAGLGAALMRRGHRATLVTNGHFEPMARKLGLDFVELGLIYEVEVEGGDVFVSFTLTSPGCPIGPQVAEQIDEFVSELEGVTSVQSRMTFSPAWTPDMMSEEAEFALGY